jgi:hypothetical protein
MPAPHPKSNRLRRRIARVAGHFYLPFAGMDVTLRRLICRSLLRAVAPSIGQTLPAAGIRPPGSSTLRPSHQGFVAVMQEPDYIVTLHRGEAA